MAPLKRASESAKQATLFSFFGKKKGGGDKPTTGKAGGSKLSHSSISNGKGSSKSVLSGKAAAKTAKTVVKKKNAAPAKTTSVSVRKKPCDKELSDSAKKRRRRAILEDTDEEDWEAGLDQEMSEADSGSEFEAGNDGNDAEESELEYDDDGEDEDDRAMTPAAKKRKTTSKKAPAKATISLSSFAREITPATPKVPNKGELTSPKELSKKFTAKPGSQSSSTAAQTGSKSSGTADVSKPPMYVEGAINPAGSHLHNHLPFVRNPKDAKGRSPGDKNYDCRTLKVDKEQWRRVNGKAMTNAVEQWWDLKAQYNDCILLFKTGKFYEIYQQDADIGVKVLGLIYMKGHVAHCGFPEVSYGVFANRLCCAGYKVARIEQTETPEMLKLRKKKDKSAKVVNREVCSILTLGTRTYSFLDDDKIFQENSDVHIGPLLCISERTLQPGEVLDATLVREFGVTMVDAPKAQVALAQFQDDVLCSHLQTFLAGCGPSEVLFQQDPSEGAENSNSPKQTLKSLFHAYRATAVDPFRFEEIKATEPFPFSTALDREVRAQLNRKNPARPWNVEETLQELQRVQYFADDSCPAELTQVIQNARANDLALSSFGCALYYLQRNLIDKEILSMGDVDLYSSPTSTLQIPVEASAGPAAPSPTVNHHHSADPSLPSPSIVDSMTLEGTTLYNLEVLSSIADNKVAGSLWSRLYHTKSPHGSRMLRAWLLRPLFNKKDIDKRAEAVEELATGPASMICNELRDVMSKIGDIQRLLSRVHSMGEMESDDKLHPTCRQVLYEEAIYTKRKVMDFRKVLDGLQEAAKIPELFESTEVKSELLFKLVRTIGKGGCFPEMQNELNFYCENVDLDKAAIGKYEPNGLTNPDFGRAVDEFERIRDHLKGYKKDQMDEFDRVGQAHWKYINEDPEKKDPWLIELPASVAVPGYYIMKGKRGSGKKQVNKYYTEDVEDLVNDLLKAHAKVQQERALGLYKVFSTFDGQRKLWEAAAHATAMLDALCALAQVASLPGYCRPQIVEYEDRPILEYKQGRHPCVEASSASQEFIPNDLSLGTTDEPERVLLLSGPNMGGKSTFLRQTCIMAILAQIGSFVPADECKLTPVDRIYTRLGASDRILLGQSTFFVELSETASALRGSSDRSLVIMDELGRGTSTFDGTAIASATVKHLVEKNKCMSLFATHYHNLLDEWAEDPDVRLGHMECMVEQDAEENGLPARVTFLYTLGKGPCPKSFGIHVGNLAGLPSDVLRKAGMYGGHFEDEMSAGILRRKIVEALKEDDFDLARQLWEQAQE